jgi:type VI secretion system protein VasG
MVAVDLRSLVAKLNDPCRRSLEAAAGYTLSRTHYNVEVEHWLLKLLDIPNGDFASILTRFEIDPGRVTTELTRFVDTLKTGNARAPSLAPPLVALVREAWLIASLEGAAGRIRSGHVLVALLADDGLLRSARESSPQLAKISPEVLRKDLVAICQASAEDEKLESQRSGATDASATPAYSSPTLDQFTIDLTQRARSGAIDPVLGRDVEIRQVIDILMRRRQNNPILTGEAGVGKTAIVEGLALAIVQNQVPPPLKNVVLRTLDLGLLQAGAGVKGEFENRLKSVIEGVQASPRPIILFIDEAHTMIGAGGQPGQSDAANLLKPALARGDLRTIAATTWAEYKKYFERDAALTRRFQVVKVEEPTDEAAIDMLGGLLPTLEQHHNVSILREALVEAVRLSRRYIPARQLPDKAVSILDTACARVAISRSATPPAIEHQQRHLETLSRDIAVLEREQQTGTDHRTELDTLTAAKAKTEDDLRELDARWQREGTLAEEIERLRERLVTGGFGSDNDDDWGRCRSRLAVIERELKDVQGETPLRLTRVDSQAVAEVVAAWTGIPLGRMLGDEIRAVLGLRDKMAERVIGQPQALCAVAEAIQTSRARLTDPKKPIGVFLMVGTSGVGKTETALTLAETLYGGEQNLTVINMSEFKEEHKVSMLLGAPPGYVGYGEGGVLTEAVRRRPYSVVLLDEMEKAHPGVQDIFYQIFDKGTARDGEGRDIDFKNTIIIMTSNAGSELIAKLCADAETAPDAAGLAEVLRPELLKIFKPAFLGRVTLVPYFPLSDEIIRSIIELQLRRIAGRIAETYRVAFDYPPALVEFIASRCRESESGARNVEQILARGLLPELSARFLEHMAAGDPISAVNVSVDSGGALSYQFD